MPLFEPFVGLRYTAGVVQLDQVIAPPYDVIGSNERVRLASRNAANAVLVELPEPDLQAGLDRYKVAARLLERWRETAIVKADPAPSFYPYRMTQTDGSTTLGVLGALGLQTPGDEADVLPHEQTLPKPKSDRLDLLRATRANLSPIWGLSLASGLTATFDPRDAPPVADAYDDDGVRHQLWVIDDQETLARVRAAVAEAPIVIADGHHRYETALAFQREVRAANGDTPGSHDFIFALVVELADEQLTVGPIHRTISGLPADTDIPAAFEEWFDVVRAGAANERTVSALGQSEAMALITPSGAYLLTARPEAFVRAYSDLDSSLVALALEGLPEHENTHRHSWREAMDAVTSGEAQAAVLLRPVTVAQIATWAEERRRMPPKTTYFSPKPRTGMVFRSLDD